MRSRRKGGKLVSERMCKVAEELATAARLRLGRRYRNGNVADMDYPAYHVYRSYCRGERFKVVGS
jgi:uncharacterized Zn finger protein